MLRRPMSLQQPYGNTDSVALLARIIHGLGLFLARNLLHVTYIRTYAADLHGITLCSITAACLIQLPFLLIVQLKRTRDMSYLDHGRLL